MSAAAFWNPRKSVRLPKTKRAPARKVEFIEGLDPNVQYITIEALAKRERVSLKVVNYALAHGRISAARRQPGRAGVLFHPAEADRWANQRRKERQK